MSRPLVLVWCSALIRMLRGCCMLPDGTGWGKATRNCAHLCGICSLLCQGCIHVRAVFWLSGLLTLLLTLRLLYDSPIVRQAHGGQTCAALFQDIFGQLIGESFQLIQSREGCGISCVQQIHRLRPLQAQHGCASPRLVLRCSLPEQVRESRIVDMVNTLNRARSQVTSAAERSALLDSITAEAGRVRSGREAETTASVLGKVDFTAAALLHSNGSILCGTQDCILLLTCSQPLLSSLLPEERGHKSDIELLLPCPCAFKECWISHGGCRISSLDGALFIPASVCQCLRVELMAAAQVLDYIKVDDFQGTESLQGNETRARVVEALKITSHTLQANRSKEGTIVTVKDLINLPREVGSFQNTFMPTPLMFGVADAHANCVPCLQTYGSGHIFSLYVHSCPAMYTGKLNKHSLDDAPSAQQ